MIMRGTHRGRPMAPFFLFVTVALTLFGGPSLLAGEEAEEYAGNFTLTFQPAKNAALKPIEKQLRESHILDATIEELNDTIALPHDVNVVFGDCGEVNAFYDGKNSRILMCYELFGYLQKRFTETYEDKTAVDQAMLDSTAFIFHHELGHALIHLLELPVTGKEEDAVDDLATLVLLHDWEGGDDSALSAADAFYMMGEDEEAAGAARQAEEKLPYWGEHSLGKQRYYEIACIVYGSNPEAHADLVGESLPKQRADRCPSEYQQKAKSWGTLLSDYFGAANEEEAEENAERMGAMDDTEDTTMYQVVINHEEQYSIWPADRELPAGWSHEGKTGTRQECLDYIREQWTN